jgi:hypothetical protein
VIRLMSWKWSKLDAETFTRGGYIVPPLSMSQEEAAKGAEHLKRLVDLSYAVEASLDPEPALPEPMLLENLSPNPIAHIRWDKQKQRPILTPLIVMSLVEAKRVHKQLGEIVRIAEGK